jgi:3-oxoacyl-(acyl-carrier-protein) synthase
MAVFVRGIGAVSPAGWGVPALRSILELGEPVATQPLPIPGRAKPAFVRRVPPPSVRRPESTHPRLRRSSAISQYTVAAALEAVGLNTEGISTGERRLGIITTMLSGCVNYSRRFYDETLRDPSMASPLLFPETVFNAPASHLAAVLNNKAINYTLVGDPGTFAQGLALAARWIESDRVDETLVIGVEEIDWLTADAWEYFQRDTIVSEGAGAVLLGSSPANEGVPVALTAITEPRLFHRDQNRFEAAASARGQLPGPETESDLLSDGLQGVSPIDDAELAAWKTYKGNRISVKQVLGEALTASAAWQTVAALDRLQNGRANTATISIIGCNQQAIAARFQVGE